MPVTGTGIRRYFRGDPEVRELQDEDIEPVGGAEVIQLPQPSGAGFNRRRSDFIESPWLSHILGERRVAFEDQAGGFTIAVVDLVTTPGYDLSDILRGFVRHIGKIELAFRGANEDVRWVGQIHRVDPREDIGIHRVRTFGLTRERCGACSEPSVMLRRYMTPIDRNPASRSIFSFAMPLPHFDGY